MISHLITGLIVAGGIINLLPLMGVVSAARLARGYGIDVADANLEILLRHRAVLFGMLGVVMIVGAFKAGWQFGVIAAGLVSMASFIALAMLVGGYNGSLRLLVIVDAAGIALLVVALVLKLPARP